MRLGKIIFYNKLIINFFKKYLAPVPIAFAKNKEDLKKGL